MPSPIVADLASERSAADAAAARHSLDEGGRVATPTWGRYGHALWQLNRWTFEARMSRATSGASVRHVAALMRATR